MATVNRKRIALLDEIRGFCILCMVFYHGFYLFGNYGGFPFAETLYRFFEPVQLLFASAFIFISGICTQFSRSVLRRGFLLLGIALLLTGITVFLLPRVGFDSFQDKFGILHLLACCMLFYAAVGKVLRRVPPIWGTAACALLYALTCRVPYGSIGFPFCSVPIPLSLLQTPFLFPLGLHDTAFQSADYFPLLPHMFVLFAGCFCGTAFCARAFPENAYRVHIRPFAFCGQHSLWIYLLHVPFLLGLVYLIRCFIV